jgi:hypothetical protein
MSSTRKTGLVLAGVAVGLWAGAIAGTVSTAPEDGANIGAALLALFAVPLSVAASILLLMSRRGARPARPAVDRAAAVLALASVVLLPASLVLGPRDDVVPQQLILGTLAAGILTFVFAAALFLYLSLRRR